MRRIVNFRPFPVIFAFCAAGVLSALVALNILPLGIAMISVVIAAATALFITAVVRRDPAKAITFLLAAALTAAATVMFFATQDGRTTLSESVSYIIEGRVTESCVHDGSELTATLDELTADGEETDGRMTVTLTDDFGRLAGIGCGDRITFVARPVVNELVSGMTVNAASVRSDVRYYAYADEEDVFFTENGEPYAMESARLYMRDSLIAFMGEDIGGISYGMIAGDRYTIPDTANEAFSAAGIGHVLSVSGLHVGLIAMILAKLIQLLRIPGVIGNIFITALLALYTVFTGAAASAVRALVMCAMTLWARYFGRRDALNSLFAACTVCLMISPYYLFECGFLMSAGSVFGLIAFTRPLTRLFSKAHMPRFFASALGSSLSVQVAILPMTAVFFSEAGLYAVIVNALLMPVLSGIFVLLVACLPFILIPPLGIIGLIPAAGVGWISAISAFVASLPFATLTVKVSALAALVLPASFIASRFVLTGNKYMRAIVAVTVSCMLVMAACNGLYSSNALTLLGGSAAVSVLVTDDGASVVADWTRGQAVASAISRSRVPYDRFDVYVLELSYESALGIVEFAEEYGVNEVIFLPCEEMTGLGVLVDSRIPFRAADENDPFDVAYVNGTPRGWVRVVNGDLCFVTDGSVYDEYTGLFDVVRGKYYYGNDPSVYAAFAPYTSPLAYGQSVTVAQR